MDTNNKAWLPLVTGLGFAVLLIISFIVSGDPKSADDGPAQVAQWYRDNKDSAEIGSFIGVVAGGFLIFFGAYLRKVFEPGAGLMLSILPLIAVAIVAVGGAIDGMLMFAAAEAADDIPAPEIQTIQARASFSTARSWFALDPELRLELVERALRAPANDVIDAFPLAL